MGLCRGQQGASVDVSVLYEEYDGNIETLDSMKAKVYFLTSSL